MNRIVIDASAAIACCLGEAEAAVLAEAVLDAMTEGTAVVPGIWASEVANAFVMKERSSRLRREETEALLGYLARLPIIVDWTGSAVTLRAVSDIARKRSLTVYDAHYLELATRLNVPLATLDHDLVRAASAEFVAIVGSSRS